MNRNTNKLRDAIMLALLTAACSTGAVVAQEKNAGVTTLERVEVTGSRIRQSNLETAQPVLVMSREDIQKLGNVSVADILQNLTAMGTPPLSRASALGSGRDAGGQYINLRNLGAERSLVLVDGKRMGITAGGYSDLAAIPSSVVERIEVLTDGASAIYGSDAIAGVVNIITRKNYDGAEVNAYLGQYGEGDGQKGSYSFTFGKTFSRGAVLFGAQYDDEDPVYGGDREFTAYPNGKWHPNDGWAANNAWGTVTVGKNKLTVGEGGDPSDVGNFRPVNPLTDYANTKTDMTLLTQLKRKSVFANGSFDITENIRFKADALYSERESSKQLAGYPYSSSSARTQSPLSADSYFNKWGEDVHFTRRFSERPRQTTAELKTYRFSAGFEGMFAWAARDWTWDVGYMYNRGEGEKRVNGSVYVPNVRNAVGPSFMDDDGVLRCGSAGNVIEGCVPWNPLAPMGSQSPGSLSDLAVQNYIFLPTRDVSETTTKVFSANIGTRLFNLPAGEVAAVLGYEHRSEDASYTPDMNVQQGLIAGSSGLPTGGGYSLDEVYLEVNVPILADMRMAKELSLSAAGRYSDYSSFGGTTNSKFGLKWKPIDSLLVRATYSTGFRAPTVDDLYGGTVETYDRYTDPCDTLFGSAVSNPAVAARCAAAGLAPDFRQTGQSGEPVTGPGAQSQSAFSSGSNPNLDAETAKTYTAGFVYSPGFVEGLDISLDWWKIEIDDAILGESATRLLDQCYVMGIESACDRFKRNSAGQVTGVDRTLVNAGYRNTAGYDLGVRYRLPETRVGQFTVNLKGTYVDYLRYKSDNEASTPVEEQNGWGGNFRVRSTMNVDWTYGDLSIGWTARYYSSTKEACSYDLTGGPECNMPNFESPYTQHKPVDRVGSNTFHDIQVRWQAPWDATISVGANNVFNHEGPIMYSEPNSSFTYYGGFDIGRFIYMKYQQRF